MTTPTDQTTKTTPAERYVPKPGEWGYWSPEALEELKRKWRWGELPEDMALQDVPGFEAYAEELKAYAEKWLAEKEAERATKEAKTAFAARLAAPFVVESNINGGLRAIQLAAAVHIFPNVNTGELTLWTAGNVEEAYDVTVSGDYAKALWTKLTGTEWPTPPENKPEPKPEPAAGAHRFDTDAAIGELIKAVYEYESDTFALGTGPNSIAIAEGIAARLIRQLTQGIRDNEPTSFACDGVMLSNAAGPEEDEEGDNPLYDEDGHIVTN